MAVGDNIQCSFSFILKWQNESITNVSYTKVLQDETVSVADIGKSWVEIHF